MGRESSKIVGITSFLGIQTTNNHPLKQPLDEAKMTGSSPEIHMIGKTHTLGHSAAALAHKHSLLVNGSHKPCPGHALSSPDLLSTCSSPDLISSVLERYRLAVAEAELRAAVPQQQQQMAPSHRGVPHVSGLWPTNSSVLPASPLLNTALQPAVIENPNKNDFGKAVANSPKKFAVTEIQDAQRDNEVQNLNNRLNKEPIRLKGRRKSPSGTHGQQAHHRPPVPKMKGSGHQNNSYLAQAGHIYYPQSSPFAMIYGGFRQPKNDPAVPDERPSLRALVCNDGPKIASQHPVHHPYEVIFPFCAFLLRSSITLPQPAKTHIVERLCVCVCVCSKASAFCHLLSSQHPGRLGG
ncbi:unnamed protein product [Gongylonema pulchrum]|uniref:ZM domain-containing protein n=1 Tax=Gongylonema pulchrum TaxID=637853 RepID=A0A183EFJ2_9BILA|nr:unnamed protein product [Gongylonema pulchrum]